MIITDLNGRLGNQLFQYAISICLAKKYDTFYVINDKRMKDSVRRYFGHISLTDYHYIRRLLRKHPNVKKAPVIEQKGVDKNTSILAKLSDNVYCKGFFQSTDFFLGYDETIRNTFKVRKKYVSSFNKKYQHLFQKKTLGIHYRIGDYKTWSIELSEEKNLCLPDRYYENALAQIPDLDRYTVLVITDDKEAISDKLPQLRNKIVISDTEINDFQILLNVDKLIISNSTFAWWGAYLNKKRPEVFAPEYWLGFKLKREYPFNIIPPEFMKVPFT